MRKWHFLLALRKVYVLVSSRGCIVYAEGDLEENAKQIGGPADQEHQQRNLSQPH